MQIGNEQKKITSQNPAGFPQNAAFPRSLGNRSIWDKESISALWENNAFRYWLALILVGVLMFGLRAFRLGQSYDIFIDEITYLNISQSVASSLQVHLHDRPFFLHPPAFFFIEALYLALLQPDGSLIHNVYATRWINVVLSSLTGVLLFMIAHRARGWLSAFVVAVLFGLNPFVIRTGSLNLLEAPAMAFIAAGYWVLISAMPGPDTAWRPVWTPDVIRKFFIKQPTGSGRQPARKRGPRAPESLVDTVPIRVRQASQMATVPVRVRGAAPIALWRLGLAGLFFGMALLVKETTAFLTLLPLLVCFLLKWVMERRAALVAGLVSVLVYSIYPLIVILSGNWALYSQQKFKGVLRFLGVIQITGFNRENGPSLAETILNRVEIFGTTYLVIAMGAAALVVLLVAPGRISRFTGVFAASSYAMMVYLIFLGTLEEQYFLYLVVPAILACGIAIGSIKKSVLFERLQRPLLIAFVCLALLFAGWDSSVWIITRTQPDNTYEQLMAYLHKNVPGGERVASTSETGQYILQGYLSGPWGQWHTVDELIQHKPEYLVWVPRSMEWNFGEEAEELARWVEQHGRLVFQASGRHGNETELYHLDWSTGR